MRRDNDIVELLNDVLTSELTAVNQYFVDSKMLANWGYERLAEKFREESIAEMKDADELIGRILFLEGVPNLQRLGTVQRRRGRRREAPGSRSRSSTSRSSGSTTASPRASPAGDNGTRELLDDVLEGEEELRRLARDATGADPPGR